MPILGFGQSTILLDSMLRFYNNHNNGTQVLQSKSVFEYNANNLIINKEEYTYYFNNLTLAFGTKTSYTYDSNNNIDIQIVRTLDSIACINYMMTDDDYDLNSNKIQSVVSYWDNSLSIFINSSKTESIYDINNNLTQTITYSWNITSSIWAYSWKREYTYNSNGFMTLMAQYTWSNGWEGHWKNAYEYDINSNLSKEEIYLWGWDGIAYTWKPNTKYEYLYDINNNILSRTVFGATSPSSSGISFLLNNKYDYSYNANNEQTEHIKSTWDSTTLSWVNSSKTESGYVNSLINVRISYSWNLVSSVWDSISKTEYLYNVSGVSIEHISYSWNNISATWVPTYKSEEINDFNGNNLLIASSQWVSTNNMWVPSFQVTGTYDNSSLCEETYVVGDMSLCDYVMQSCGIFSVFNNNPLSNIYYDYNTNVSDSTLFFYSDFSTEIDDISIMNEVHNRDLIRISDALGRETDRKKNTLLFYIYNDGTVEKRITIE
jgi:hypothetical protein